MNKICLIRFTRFVITSLQLWGGCYGGSSDPKLFYPSNPKSLSKITTQILNPKTFTPQIHNYFTPQIQFFTKTWSIRFIWHCLRAFDHLWLSYEHDSMVGRVVLQSEKICGMVFSAESHLTHWDGNWSYRSNIMADADAAGKGGLFWTHLSVIWWVWAVIW